MNDINRFVKLNEGNNRGLFSYLYQIVTDIYHLNIDIDNIYIYVNLINITGYISKQYTNNNLFDYCFEQSNEDYEINKELYLNINKNESIEIFLEPYKPEILTFEIREQTSKIIKKFFKLKNELISDIENNAVNIDFSKTIGVHRRNTDILLHHRPVPIENIFEKIDSIEYEKIFLMCDNFNDYNLFIERYGDKIICFDTTMSKDSSQPYFKLPTQDFDSYYHCQEMVKNIYLFSKCKEIIIPLSNYSGFSLLMNPELVYTILK